MPVANEPKVSQVVQRLDGRFGCQGSGSLEAAKHLRDLDVKEKGCVCDLTGSQDQCRDFFVRLSPEQEVGGCRRV